MKQLQKSELVEGEIYSSKSSLRDSTELFIWKCDKNGKLFYSYRLWSRDKVSGAFNLNNAHSWDNIFEATEQEKHWLETCIKADRFVSYEEAMKTFIPEYVECIIVDSLIEVGKVYKTTSLKDWPVPSNNGCTKVYTLEIGNNNPYYTSQFKPSTKEAYDAQFVVKEPEFVLPELWCIKLTVENQKTVIDYINKNTNDGERSGNIGMYYGYNGVHCTSIFNTLSNTEITFDQFEKYVLKENTTITEEPKVVFEEPKDKVLQLNQLRGKGTTIVQVECSEGGVYRIGDKIRVFGGSKNPVFRNKQYFTIQSFRWSNDKSKICAVFNVKFPNGIGLDKIELYIEPKVEPVQELSLLEQAKLKYIKGIKIIPIGAMSKIKLNPVILNHNIDMIENKSGVYIKGVQGWVFSKIRNEWAEIVEDFVLPEKWCVEVNDEIRNRIGYYEAYGYHHSIQINDTNKWSDKIKEGFTEITFEQFKKYVLKDE